MSKFLIDPATSKVRGTFSPPLEFSIFNRYVIDSPDSLGVRAVTDSVADLVNAKVEAFQRTAGMTGFLNDEMLSSLGVDSSQSARFGTGVNKRTHLLATGGQIVTNPLFIAPAMTQVYAHWYGFILSLLPDTSIPTPVPNKLRYNWDPNASAFTEFDPSNFTVEIRDVGNTVTLLTLTSDVETAFVAGPALNFRLRFTNNDPNHVWHLSDWILLYS